MYIQILLILTVIIIILAFVYKKKLFENYKAPTTLPPNYEKYNTQLTHIANDPSGEPLAFDPKNNFNYTQLSYAFFVQLFQTISQYKKKYDMVLKENYAKNTIDYNNLDSLNQIMRPLLLEIKKLAPKTDFWVTGYESWRIYQDKNSPLKINQIDCWVWDRVHLTQLRLFLEICEMPKKDGDGKYECRYKSDPNIKTCTQESTPDFPRYIIGIPSNDQIIPLPTEVIETGNEVINFKGLDFKVPCDYEKIWINYVEIFNSSLVLNAYENFKDEQLKGYDTPILDYTVWRSKNNSPIQDPNRVNNQWPTLEDQPKGIKAYPSQMYPFVWDLAGLLPANTPTPKAPGKRYDLEQTPLTASFFNSYFNQPRGQTEYTWLFANTNKDMGLQYEGY